jgi:hypothetical protein
VTFAEGPILSVQAAHRVSTAGPDETFERFDSSRIVSVVALRKSWRFVAWSRNRL